MLLFLPYIFPFPVGIISFTDTLNVWYTSFWNTLVPWAGKYMLQVNYPIISKSNGSGDTSYHYVQLFLFVIIAIIIAFIGSVADRKRKSYDLLLYWLMVYVRYYLAFTIMRYGFYKIIKTQFPFPFYNLTQHMANQAQWGSYGISWVIPQHLICSRV